MTVGVSGCLKKTFNPACHCEILLSSKIVAIQLKPTGKNKRRQAFKRHCIKYFKKPLLCKKQCITKPCGFVLMTASLTGLPPRRDFITARNDTAFLLSGYLKKHLTLRVIASRAKRTAWQSSFANRQNKTPQAF